MNPFDHTSKCPKCGHKEVSTVYHKAGEHGAGLCTAGIGCKGAPEYLLRTCQRCHFNWREKPLKVVK